MIGVTFYSTRFYSDDVGHRLLLLLQIGAAGAMAVNISRALNDTFSGFAISYAFMRFILVTLATGSVVIDAKTGGVLGLPFIAIACYCCCYWSLSFW